ncbi:hypothetical protein TWF730_003029 [Orbilia blumenaviensis]|uniref:Ankyrin repeat protein n=1 Tax=Orbilia blumenaviensis TaxID=1796055 RepID=A0AAV9U7V3_9PEZI
MEALLYLVRHSLFGFQRKRIEGSDSFKLRTLRKHFSQPKINSASSSENDLSAPVGHRDRIDIAIDAASETYRFAGSDPDSGLPIESLPFSQRIETWLSETLPPPDASFDEKQYLIAQDNLESLLECAIYIYEAGKPLVGKSADYQSSDDIRGVVAAAVLQTRDFQFRKTLVQKILGNTSSPEKYPSDEKSPSDANPVLEPSALSSEPVADGLSPGLTQLHPANELLGDGQGSLSLKTLQPTDAAAPQLQHPQTTVRGVCIVDENLIFPQLHSETIPKRPASNVVTKSALQNASEGPGSLLSSELGGYLEPTAVEDQRPSPHLENSASKTVLVYTETTGLESGTDELQRARITHIEEEQPDCNNRDAQDILTSQPSSIPEPKAAAPPTEQTNQKSTAPITNKSALQPKEHASGLVPKYRLGTRRLFATELIQSIPPGHEDTRLHDAVKNNDLHMVRYLLERGIDIFKENTNTTIARLPANAIAYCVKYRRKDILWCFLRHDIKCYPTAIWETLRYGDDEIREFITEKYKELRHQLDALRSFPNQNYFILSQPDDPVIRGPDEPFGKPSRMPALRPAEIQIVGCKSPITELQGEYSSTCAEGTYSSPSETSSAYDSESDVDECREAYHSDSDSLYEEEGDDTERDYDNLWRHDTTKISHEYVDGGEDGSIPSVGGSTSVPNLMVGSGHHVNGRKKRVQPPGGSKKGDEDDEDDNSSEPPNKKQAIDSGGGGGPPYRCPFFLIDAVEYSKCEKTSRKDLSGLKEHLKRNHFEGKRTNAPDLYDKKKVSGWHGILNFCRAHEARTRANGLSHRRPAPSRLEPSDSVAGGGLVGAPLGNTQNDNFEELLRMAFSGLPQGSPSRVLRRTTNITSGDDPTYPRSIDAMGTPSTEQKQRNNLGDSPDPALSYVGSFPIPKVHTHRGMIVGPGPQAQTSNLPIPQASNFMPNRPPQGQVHPRVPSFNGVTQKPPLQTGYAPYQQNFPRSAIGTISVTQGGLTQPPSEEYGKAPALNPKGVLPSFPPRSLPGPTTSNQQQQFGRHLTNTTPASQGPANPYLNPTSQQQPPMLPPNSGNFQMPSALASSPVLTLGEANKFIDARPQPFDGPIAASWRKELEVSKTDVTKNPKSTMGSRPSSLLSTAQEISTPITQISDVDAMSFVRPPSSNSLTNTFLSSSFNVPSSSSSPRKKYEIAVRLMPQGSQWRPFHLDNIDELRQNFDTWMAKGFPDIQFSWAEWCLQTLSPNKERIYSIDALADELNYTRWNGIKETITTFYLIRK